MIFISNFNISRDLSETQYFFDNYEGTNIDFILEGFSNGETNWSVHKKAAPGDIVIFMCAKTAKNNFNASTSHIPADSSPKFHTFVKQQKSLYKKYSGHLLGYGIVSSSPEYNSDFNWWMADIKPLQKFDTPIYIDDFRSFIFISRTGSFTVLQDDQWERLKWTINQKNPGFFQNVTAPDIRILEQEFDNAVRVEEKKSLDKLKKQAEKKSSLPAKTTVQTTTYSRDPTIAAYVKQRANGHCQLCGNESPFIDQNGFPYLECHHIVWLSNGGADSADNCVALCPNCHRKMHILNNPNDVTALKRAIR